MRAPRFHPYTFFYGGGLAIGRLYEPAANELGGSEWNKAGQSAHRSRHDTLLEAQKSIEAFVFVNVIIILDYAFSVYRSLPRSARKGFSIKQSVLTSAVHFTMALASFWIGRVRGCGIMSSLLWDDVGWFGLSF